MSRFHCSEKRPWGIHPVVRNDEACPRCGWLAPGPKGDALAAALENGWAVIDGGAGEAPAALPSRRAA
jgi:hypothetical protein